MAEQTPVERAAATLWEYVGTHVQDMEAEGVPEIAVREAEVRVVLDAALDVDELARVLQVANRVSEPRWDGLNSDQRAAREQQQLPAYRELARAIREHVLGGNRG